MRTLALTGLTLLAALAVLPAPVSGGAHAAPISPAPLPRCTLVGFLAPLAERAVFFLGVALPDTVRVGRAPFRIPDAQGHYGRASRRVQYGQLVRVTRYGGPGMPLSADRDSLAVVIPWDYDAQCRAIRWTQSDRFVAPGTLLFFQPTLRERADWVGGRPTFDAFVPEAAAFPNANSYVVRAGRVELLAPELLFELYSRVPTRQAVEQRGWGAVTPVLEWARVHLPSLEAYPVRAIFSDLTAAAERAPPR